MNYKIKLASVFSGIGAIEHALIKKDIPFEIVFACDNGERYLDMDYEKIIENLDSIPKDQHNEYIKKLYNNTNKPNRVKETFFENYSIDESRWYEDVRFIDGNRYKSKIDLFVGGSPCQSFSIIGKRAGLDDVRGTLFYDFARLINDIKPKVFIFENVLGMLSHNNGNSWNVIKDVFNSLNYKIYGPIILNSKNFGIPQDRKRLFVVGFQLEILNFKEPVSKPLHKTMFDFLEKEEIDSKYYLGKKGFEFVTNPKYKNRARVNSLIIQTEKANQQFNWNGDFVFEDYDKVKDNPKILEKAYIGLWKGRKGVIRKLTHKECMRLMGFNDDFKINKNNVAAYRQAGNSIVVNVLEALLDEIFEVVNLYEEN